MRLHPSYATPRQKRTALHKSEGRRSAGRRKSNHRPHRRMRQRAFAQSALASRRSTAALTKAVALRLNPGPRFLKLPGANGRTLPGASAASTSQTDPSAGLYDARSRPGAKLRASPAGTARASVSGSSLETPFMSAQVYVTINVTYINELVTKYFHIR